MAFKQFGTVVKPSYKKKITIGAGGQPSISLTEREEEEPFSQKYQEQMQLAGGKAAIQTQKEAAAQEAKAGIKAGRSMTKVAGQLKQSLYLWGKMANKTKELTGGMVGPGRIAGVANIGLGQLTGANPYVVEFEGDKQETATSIAKIAAPSAKVGPELIRTFSKTLPRANSTAAEARGQVISSIANSYYEYASTHPKEYPKGIDMPKMRARAEKEVDDYIRSKSAMFKNLYPDVIGKKKEKTKKGRVTSDPLGLF